MSGKTTRWDETVKEAAKYGFTVAGQDHPVYKEGLSVTYCPVRQGGRTGRIQILTRQVRGKVRVRQKANRYYQGRDVLSACGGE
jgi:hypothetical protein